METSEKFRENKTTIQSNNETINIPIYKILLIIGILTTIIGVIMCAGIKYIEFLDLYIDTNLGAIVLPVGIGLICGYVTHAILSDRKNSFVIGLVLGIIGILIAIFIKMDKNKY